MLEVSALWLSLDITGFFFKEVIWKLVQAGFKDYTKDCFKSWLKDATQLATKPPLQRATKQAIKNFLRLVELELLSWNCSKKQMKLYKQPLAKLLRDDLVKIELGKAFQHDCNVLSYQIFIESWERLQLPSLPDRFSWTRIMDQYLIQVQDLMRESSELRVILDSKNIEITRQEIQGINRNIQAIVGIAPDFNLEKYAESIQESYGHLKLNVLDSTDEQYRVCLWNVFIPLSVREALPPSRYDLTKEIQRQLQAEKQLKLKSKFQSLLENLEQYKQNYLQQPIRPILEILSDKNYPYIVILGDPGSGKSTLLQWLMLRWIEERTAQLPLLVELREYTRDRTGPRSFLEFFHQGTRAICNLDQQVLDRLLRAGSALVMFDGLDEIFDSDIRQTVITEIHRFTNEYKGSRVIVTSRIVGYNAEYLREAGFHHLTLQDLDKNQVKLFIEVWHNLVLSNDSDRKILQTRLEKAIDDSQAISELAINPLLLTMMVILNRRQELPRDRPELYDQASRVLLYNWDIDYKRLQVPTEAIGRPEKQAILRRIAYEMQLGKDTVAANIISRENLLEIITQFLKERDFTESRNKANILLEQLRTRNFILCYLGDNYYAFVHRTFLEYFCAWEIIDRFEKQRILTEEQLRVEIFGKYWQDKSWHEVLRLITGMVGEKIAGSIIDHLITEERDPDKCSNLVLAAQCLSEVRNKVNIKPISEKLLNLLKEVARQQSQKLDYPDILKIIRVIAQVWEHDPTTLTWLKDNIQTNHQLGTVSIQLIAQVWKHSPDTLLWLKSFSQSNYEAHLRLIAVYEIVDRWKDDPDTLPWLKSLAESDENSSFREGVVKEIAIGWTNDVRTLSWLQSRAQVDRAILVMVICMAIDLWSHNSDAMLWADSMLNSLDATQKLVVKRRLHSRGVKVNSSRH